MWEDEQIGNMDVFSYVFPEFLWSTAATIYIHTSCVKVNSDSALKTETFLNQISNWSYGLAILPKQTQFNTITVNQSTDKHPYHSRPFRAVAVNLQRSMSGSQVSVTRSLKFA
jgi:CDP-diacylglycerol pyrophosphatase